MSDNRHVELVVDGRNERTFDAVGVVSLKQRRDEFGAHAGRLVGKVRKMKEREGARSPGGTGGEDFSESSR